MHRAQPSTCATAGHYGRHYRSPGTGDQLERRWLLQWADTAALRQNAAATLLDARLTAARSLLSPQSATL